MSMAVKENIDTGRRASRLAWSEPAEANRDADMDSTVPRGPQVRRLSNASSILSDIFKHPDLQEETLRRKMKESDDQYVAKDLVDFLRNAPPPSHNAMSRVDGDSSEEEETDWWRKGLRKVFRKNKTKKNKNKVKKSMIQRVQNPRPEPVTLPDMAVAGRTAKGHRHIAISIPVEDAHVSYLAYQSEEAAPAVHLIGEVDDLPRREEVIPEIRTGLARPHTDLRGVTILRPVFEGREFPETVLEEEEESDDSMLNEDRLSRAASPTNMLDRVASHRLSRRNRESIAIKNELPRPQTAEPSFLHDMSWQELRTPATRRRSWTNPADSANLHVPDRHSSVGRASMDSNSSFDMVPIRRHRREISSAASDISRHSLALSITDSVATDGTEPFVEDATTAHGYEPAASIRLSVHGNAETVVYAPVLDVARRRTIDLSGSGPLFPSLDEFDYASDAQSLLRRATSLRSTRRSSPVRAPTPGSRTETLVNSVNSGKRPTTSDSLSFVPFMVVADLEPCDLSDSVPPSALQPLQPSKASPSGSELARPATSAHPASGGPTPPHSPLFSDPDTMPHKIPPRSRSINKGSVPLDRVSLHRRREWAAEREREQAEADERARVEAEIELARNEAALAVLDTADDEQLSDEKRRPRRRTLQSESHENIVRRYNDVRESHERDVESRLMRLEQDGEAWLSTMVSMFERLNHNLARIQDSDEEDFEPAALVDGDASIEYMRLQRLAQEYRARQEEERRERMQWQQTMYEDGQEEALPDAHDSRRGRHHRHSMYNGESRFAQDVGAEEPVVRRTNSVAGRRPLSSHQTQFESEVTQRRRLEQLDEVVEARLANMPRSMSHRSSRPSTAPRSKRKNHMSAVDQPDVINVNTMVRPKAGLDIMEPLMLELTGSSRLSFEKVRPAGRKVHEGHEYITSEAAENLFEGF